MSNPLIIGITGGIGSGKSTLADKLRAQGFEVYDSDMEARRLQNEHPYIVQELKKLFGSDIYNSGGLNRQALARIVFTQKDLLGKLNEIIHPVVKADFQQWIKKHSSAKLLFMESAILFESGFDKLVDKVILMTASETVRIARVVKRDGSLPEQVKARMSNQLPDEKKVPRADFIIYSDDNKPLIDKMLRILDDLLK